MSSSSPPPTLPPTLATPLRQAIDKANTADARIQALLLSTLEGVPLGRVAHTDHASYEALETIWAPPSKQYGLLGKVKKVTAFYDHAVVLHVYQGPLVCKRLCFRLRQSSQSLYARS